MAIKTKLGKFLEQEGRSNKWLAKKMDKTPNTISLWVHGKVSITLDDLYLIAELLNTNIKGLIYSSKEEMEKELKKLKSDKKYHDHSALH